MPALLFHEVLAQELEHQLGTVEIKGKKGKPVKVIIANTKAQEYFEDYLGKVEELENAKSECTNVKDELERGNQINQAVLPLLYKTIHTLENPRTVLCFSGGGIRSATFGLGILQALAHWKLLDSFDYLSTVSGGGYIGSWLSAWIKRTEDTNRLFTQSDFINIESLAAKLNDKSNKISEYLQTRLSPDTLGLIGKSTFSPEEKKALQNSLAEDFNNMLKGESLLKQDYFKQLATEELKKLEEKNELISLNRKLIENAYPGEIIKSTEKAVGVIQVQKELGDPCGDKNLPEPEEVTHLRAYSRYMSPELGLLSADTWTLVAIYARNLLLNWFVLIPLFAAFLLLPRILFTFTYSTATNDIKDSLATIFVLVIELGLWATAVYILRKGLPYFLIITLASIGVSLAYFFSTRAIIPLSTTFFFLVGILCGGSAVAYIIGSRPSLNSAGLTKIPKDKVTQGRVLLYGVLLLVIWAYFSSNYWATFVYSTLSRQSFDFPVISFLFPHPVIAFLAFGWAVHVLGLILYRVLLKKNPFADIFNRTFGFELTVAIFNGALGGLITWLVASNIFAQPITDRTRAMLYACLAVPTLLLLFVFALTIFVGLTSKRIEDMDREWLARFAGWILIVSLVWIVLHAIVLYGPTELSHLWQSRYSIWKAILTMIGGTSALITLLGGYFSQFFNKNSEKETGGNFAWIMNIAPKVAAPIFALFLLVLLVYVTSLLLRLVSVELACGDSYVARTLTKILGLTYDFTDAGTTDKNFCNNPVYYYDPSSIRMILTNVNGWYLLAVLSLLAAIGGIMGTFVNINKFSLHAAYRDRLIRAYLGASRKKSERKENPFTGFDENDNVQMEKLRQTKPLHIINQTLNVVRGKNLAWQDRKAESFTASPLHCGSFLLGYRNSAGFAVSKVFDFLSGGRKEQALSLGTALAISGAAASPNMGYYSSPIVTFLLAVFNVRLGWWLGNPGPAGEETYMKAGPAFAARPLIEETLGLTDDENPYIYLSDGGHFENLGLYEMVRRRCHLIVVSDASGDDGFAYDDFANAIEKVRVDLGIPININFSDIPIYPPKSKDIPTSGARYCAIARISYKTIDGEDARDGLLIYIKPTLYGKEPIDIIHYAKDNPTFPHQSTANQFFNEKQFESYRTLGFYIGHRVFVNEIERKRSGDKKEGSDFTQYDFSNMARLCKKLKEPADSDEVSKYIRTKLIAEKKALLDAYIYPDEPTKELRDAIVQYLNTLFKDATLYNANRFSDRAISETAEELIKRNPADKLSGEELALLNRILLEDAYPNEIASEFSIKKLIGLMKKLDKDSDAKFNILLSTTRKQLGVPEFEDKGKQADIPKEIEDVWDLLVARFSAGSE